MPARQRGGHIQTLKIQSSKLQQICNDAQLLYNQNQTDENKQKYLSAKNDLDIILKEIKLEQEDIILKNIDFNKNKNKNKNK